MNHIKSVNPLDDGMLHMWLEEVQASLYSVHRAVHSVHDNDNKNNNKNN